MIINTDNADKEKSGSCKGAALDYHFTESEIRLLAKFFRKHQSELPDGLIDFSDKIERSVYNTMSIEEAEVFFS